MNAYLVSLDFYYPIHHYNRRLAQAKVIIWADNPKTAEELAYALYANEMTMITQVTPVPHLNLTREDKGITICQQALKPSSPKSPT